MCDDGAPVGAMVLASALWGGAGLAGSVLGTLASVGLWVGLALAVWAVFVLPAVSIAVGLFRVRFWWCRRRRRHGVFKSRGPPRGAGRRMAVRSVLNFLRRKHPSYTQHPWCPQEPRPAPFAAMLHYPIVGSPGPCCGRSHGLLGGGPPGGGRRDRGNATNGICDDDIDQVTAERVGDAFAALAENDPDMCDGVLLGGAGGGDGPGSGGTGGDDGGGVSNKRRKVELACPFPGCGMTFGRANELANHRRAAHAGNEKHCPHGCGYVAKGKGNTWKTALARHVKSCALANDGGANSDGSDEGAPGGETAIQRLRRRVAAALRGLLDDAGAPAPQRGTPEHQHLLNNAVGLVLGRTDSAPFKRHAAELGWKRLPDADRAERDRRWRAKKKEEQETHGTGWALMTMEEVENALSGEAPPQHGSDRSSEVSDTYDGIFPDTPTDPGDYAPSYDETCDRAPSYGSSGSYGDMPMLSASDGADSESTSSYTGPEEGGFEGEKAWTEMLDKEAEAAAQNPHFKRQGPKMLQHTVGKMDHVCEDCGALLFAGEVATTKGKPKHGTICCAAGLVPKLPPHEPLSTLESYQDRHMRKTTKARPDPIKGLFQLPHFLRLSRWYNNLLAFAAAIMKAPKWLNRGGGPQAVVVQGKVCHTYAGVLKDPESDETVRNIQSYFVGPGEKGADWDAPNHIRKDILNALRQDFTKAQGDNPKSILNKLRDAKKHYDKLMEEKGGEVDDFSIVFDAKEASKIGDEYKTLDYESEVTICYNIGASEGSSRHVAVYMRDGTTRFVNEFDPLYEILTYPLFHPDPKQNEHTGEFTEGYGPTAFQTTRPRTEGKKKKNIASYVSPKEYGMYYLHHRMGGDARDELELNPILRCGQLTQQWVVDMACRAELANLNFYASDEFQKYKVKAEKYHTFREMVEKGKSAKEFGKQKEFVVLPASFKDGWRGKRDMVHNAQTLTTKKEFGKPDFFITMVASSKWKDITDNLAHNLEGSTQTTEENPNDRPDLIARVFYLKMKALVKDIRDGCLGKNIGICWVIEYQKRGLPHVHILAWNAPGSKTTTSRMIDRTVHAELVDRNKCPGLFELQCSKLLHTSCKAADGLTGKARQRALQNAPCAKKDKKGKLHCRANFPFPFRDVSEPGCDTYAKPRRRPFYKNPKSKKWPRAARNGCDNRRVVSTNLPLFVKYRTHVNVEVCRKIGAIQYLVKYFHKRVGAGVLSARQGRNEVKEYEHTRTLGSTEGAAKLFGMRHFFLHPSTMALGVHEPGKQNVYYHDKATNENLQDKECDSTLTAYFKAVASIRGASTLLYTDMPRYFVWGADGARRQWHLRAGLIFDEAAGVFRKMRDGDPGYTSRTRCKMGPYGRIYSTDIRCRESYAIRCLLLHTRGAASFDDLRTVGMPDGSEKVCDTFAEACIERGIYENPKEPFRAMKEARDVFALGPSRLRHFFAMLLVHTAVHEPGKLWDKFKKAMARDVSFDAQVAAREGKTGGAAVREMQALLDIGGVLAEFGKTLEDYGLEKLVDNEAIARKRAEVNKQARDENQQWQKFKEMGALVKGNDAQRGALESIQAAVARVEAGEFSSTGECFFIQGPAGTGKTFLYNTVLAWFYSHRGDKARQGELASDGTHAKPRVALPVAHSALAALLLDGGMTSHSRFGVSRHVDFETGRLNVEEGTAKWEYLRAASLIVWDEAPTSDKRMVRMIDRELRRIRGIDAPFGGMVTLFGGDFQQCPPIAKDEQDDPAAAIQYSIRFAGGQGKLFNWTRCIEKPGRLIKLTKPMRQRNDEKFANWLARIGAGSGGGGKKSKKNNRAVEMLPECCSDRGGVPYSRGSLVKEVFKSAKTEEDLLDRAVLAVRNEAVDELNAMATKMFGKNKKEHVLLSKDVCHDEEKRDAIPLEMLHQSAPRGLLQHELRIKVGMPVMITCNFHVSKGLCNGTRAIVMDVGREGVKVKVKHPGTGQWDEHVLPRTTQKIEESDSAVGVEFFRTQFPIRPAYAMTINKSQGQTLGRVGVDLTKHPCFQHGQLYVALSRVRERSDLMMAVDPKCVAAVGGGAKKSYSTTNIVNSNVIEGIVEATGAGSDDDSSSGPVWGVDEPCGLHEWGSDIFPSDGSDPYAPPSEGDGGSGRGSFFGSAASGECRSSHDDDGFHHDMHGEEDSADIHPGMGGGEEDYADLYPGAPGDSDDGYSCMMPSLGCPGGSDEGHSCMPSPGSTQDGYYPPSSEGPAEPSIGGSGRGDSTTTSSDSCTEPEAKRRRATWETYDGRHPLRVPGGIANPRNSCFMSASLQALYFLARGRAGRLWGEAARRRHALSPARAFITSVFDKLAATRGVAADIWTQQVAQQLQGTSAAMRAIVDARPREQGQCDAGEFLQALCDDARLTPTVESRTTLICKCCNTPRRPQGQLYMFFALPIATGARGTSMRALLREHLADGERPGIECETCRKAKRRRRQDHVTRESLVAGDLLILQIKRTVFVHGVLAKHTAAVDVTQPVSVGGSSYEPQAVVFHHGATTTSGHYTASCRYKGRWVNFDDAHVAPGLGGMEGAYIVFYARAGLYN